MKTRCCEELRQSLADDATPTPHKCARLLLLLPLALAQTPEEAAAHEANAQKQLADMLTDSLAMLRHGSAASVESAAEGIAALAVETTVSQPFHPITFRNAALKAGVVDELTRLLVDAHDGKASTRAMHFSLLALEAIATDDPSTDLDNGHALAVCKAGAVAPVVTLLRHDDEMVQVAAAGCAAILAECPQCQAALLQQGAAEPLVALGTYGNDAAKMRAVAALDLLALNNPAAQKRIELAGGLRLLGGIAKYGDEGLRPIASELLGGLSGGGGAKAVAVDAKAHASQAHQARVKHSRLWEQRVGIRRAYAPGAPPHPDDDELS